MADYDKNLTLKRYYFNVLCVKYADLFEIRIPARVGSRQRDNCLIEFRVKTH